MIRAARYRIRWGNVTGPWTGGRRRMCMAEKRVHVFGLIPIWWPLEHGNWRDDEAACKVDIDYDIDFSRPLPSPKEKISKTDLAVAMARTGEFTINQIRSFMDLPETPQGETKVHLGRRGAGDGPLTLHSETTPEGGIIRLAKWPEGYVLWFNGQIVWRSWLNEPQKVTLKLNVDCVDAQAAIAAMREEGSFNG